MTEKRLQGVAQSSRLRVRFAEPFTTVSHLGGTLGVSEAVIGLAQDGTFVGPNFSRHGDAWAEHLQCEYLPALELACLPALTVYCRARTATPAPSSSATKRGRIVMPPPDIAPSCS
jgi:hypothetical protein